MKKIIGLTLLSAIILVLLIVGSVNVDNATNKDVAPSSLALLLLVWLLSTVLTLPILVKKNKSMFLTVISWIQVFTTPLNVIFGSIYIFMIYKGHFKEDASDFQEKEVVSAN